MSRCILSLACVLVTSAATVAAEKPNTLTAKEIADGWILLFDGETTFGWKVDGDAKVKDGELVLAKGKQVVAYSTCSVFPEASLSYEINGSARVHVTNQAIIHEPAENAGWIRYSILKKEKSWEIASSYAVLKTGGGERPKGSERSPFCVVTSGDTEVRIKSTKLTPTGTKPLFNGKDLTGWQVTQADPKRTATKFEVTKDGELSAKNGPGDLQTEKQFDDFVLQLECKTLGKALNSGVFFRCIPDQYQNGYEAQIQNAWIGDRTKPLDFGTGAIYRRIAARKVVADDNEWFTLTLAAQGPHFSTWVNGYQTVDWTDDRKANDNPRQGLRLAKGHLSIQGHDPTTDLLFRNIRIVELAK